MSHVVRTAVRRHSRASRATLAILKELAEFAHHDGITWISQETLVEETTYSEREVRSAIRWLEQNGELETRKAQRGRRRINVYRVIVGPIGMTDPAYDRLPFALIEPFSRPADIAGGRDGLSAIAASAPASSAPASDDRQYLPPVATPDDRQSDGLTTGSPTRARVEEDPSLNRQTEEANASSVPADAGESETRKQEISLELSALLGLELRGMTRAERSKWETAIAQLVKVGATRAQVEARCVAYRSIWPSVRLTAWALVTHWSELGAAVMSGTGADPVAAWCERAPEMFELEVARELLDDRAGLNDEQRIVYHRKLDEAYALQRQVA